jgi:redox-sensitive bicupin YhaK (pirin superfamily)
MPHGKTGMHGHHEIDVISVMVNGNIAHEGSLEHGKDLSTNDVQVQRAGGEGFKHNEINPDESWNRMLQLWVLPEKSGQAADYKVYQPTRGEMTRIYGGDDSSDFPAKTQIDVAVLSEGEEVKVNAPFLAYLSRGEGVVNNVNVEDGDLMRGDSFKFTARNDVQLVIVHV